MINHTHLNLVEHPLLIYQKTLYIFLYYLIRATNTLSRILEQVEKDVNNIGDITKEMLEDIRDNPIFNFLFGKKRKSRKNK